MEISGPDLMNLPFKFRRPRNVKDRSSGLSVFLMAISLYHYHFLGTFLFNREPEAGQGELLSFRVDRQL